MPVFQAEWRNQNSRKRMSLIHNDTLPGVNQFDTVISRLRKVYSYLPDYYLDRLVLHGRFIPYTSV